MKILKIFGIVVAVHAAVFIFIFAIPGCRSTGKTASSATAENPAGGAAVGYADAGGSAPLTPAPAAGTTSSHDLNPALVPAGNSVSFDPTLPAGSGVRFAPTRPGSSPAPTSQAPAPGPAPAAASETYTVVKGDSLWTVAKKHAVSVSQLAAANNLKAGSVLRLGQKLVVPGKSVAADTGSAPAGNGGASADGQTYLVKAGDTLAVIARRNGTTAATLKAMNNLKTDIVRPGQTLALPTSSGTTIAPAGTEPATPAPTPKASRSASMITHTVKAGETLGSIAKKYQVQVGEIAAANNISDPAKIRPGQDLMIPGWQGSTGAKTAKSTAAPAPAADKAATPPPALSRTPPPAADSFLNTPPIGQDLDAGLQKSAEEVPVIKVEDAGAPKID